MWEQSSKDFKALCQQYGLPEDERAFSLSLIFEAGPGIMPVSSGLPEVFGVARMLKQIHFARKRGFSLLARGIKEDYGAEGVEVLGQSLTDALHQWVAKREYLGQAELGINVPDNLFEEFKGLSVNMVFGPTGVGNRTIWLHPEGCQPQKYGFNLSELDAIIGLGEELKARVEKLKGRRGDKDFGGQDKSRNPELGMLSGLVLKYLPEDMGTISKYAFVFDFLMFGGWLDFKGEMWENDRRFFGSKEKYDEVKSWVRTAEKIKK